MSLVALSYKRICNHCNTGSCAYVCVCVPRTPHGGLSDTSALEISSGGGSGLNSLPVRIRTGVRTLRSPVLESRYALKLLRVPQLGLSVVVFLSFTRVILLKLPLFRTLSLAIIGM